MMQSRCRLVALLAAGCGVVSGITFICFWADGFILSLLFSEDLVWRYFGAYILAAVGAVICKGRVAAFFAAGASLLVFALGAYMYYDMIYTPPNTLNDIDLVIPPRQHSVAMTAVIVGLGSLVVHYGRRRSPVAANVVRH